MPRDLIVETIEQVPKSVAELAPLVDYHIELLNDPKTPDIEIVTPGETWENFTAQWVQYVILSLDLWCRSAVLYSMFSPDALLLFQRTSRQVPEITESLLGGTRTMTTVTADSDQVQEFERETDRPDGVFISLQVK